MRRHLLSCLILSLAAYAPTALTADLVVPDDFATIQAAIDAAATDDRVLVRPGTYTEKLELADKRLLIESTDGSAATILAGDGVAGFLIQISGEDTRLELHGMTLSGGFGQAGSNGAGPGGGILVDGGSIAVQDSLFTSNAGIFGGAISIIDGEAHIANSRFENNAALHGGAIYVEGGLLDIASSEFIDNTATNFGGAVAIFWNSTVNIGDTEFSANSAGDFGAAIYALSAALDFSKLTVSGNGQAEPGQHNSWIINTSGGGGMYLSNSTGRLQDSRILDNIAAAGSGLYLASGGTVEVINTLIAGNGRLCGCGQGAVYANASSPSLINSTIVDNGGVFGLFTTYNAFPVVRNSIIAGLADGADIFAPIGGNGLTDVDYSLLQGQSGGVLFGDNNRVIDTFPMLDASQDFGPMPGSGAIDAGDNVALPTDITTDLVGNPRIADGGNGDLVDIGAIEFPEVAMPDSDTISRHNFRSN